MELVAKILMWTEVIMVVIWFSLVFDICSILLDGFETVYKRLIERLNIWEI